jgi:hypothetical protein
MIEALVRVYPQALLCNEVGGMSGLSAPASAVACGMGPSLSGLEPVSSALCLLDILIAEAPKNHAIGRSPDRDRYIEVTSDAQNVVLYLLGLNPKFPRLSPFLVREGRASHSSGREA